MGDTLLIYVDPKDSTRFITAEVDDDSSAIAKSMEIIKDRFGIISEHNFTYLGEIEHHGDASYSVVQFLLPKNYPIDPSKRYISFFPTQKEFDNKSETNFNLNDTFVLAVGFRISAEY